jgi:hypothetical protein
MSGNPYQDSGNTARWSWQIGEGYKQCSLSVYVPKSGRSSDVAGNPTTYQVMSSTGYNAQATFNVRQVDHRGSLVAAGSYPVQGKTFTVQLLDRGQGGPDGHHAAAQMKLRCTA